MATKKRAKKSAAKRSGAKPKRTKSAAKGAKKSVKKSAAKSAKKPAAKSAKKSVAKKPAKTSPATTDTVAVVEIVEVAFSDVESGPQANAASAETEAAQFLKDYDDGNIDNAWDVIGDLADLDKRLSKTSALRPAFDKMYGEIEDICRESSGG
jgi:hypothetical protein